MSKKSIFILFLVLISALSYSCVAKKITRPTPKETDKKLSITIDYYGENITTAPDDAVTVEVYKTKDSVNDVNIRAFKVYTIKDFIDSKKPVMIPLNYEVVITIEKKVDGDSTDISGNVPDDGTFQSKDKKFQIKMDDHKSFIITFSQVEIEKVAINFEALGNGRIDVVVKKDDSEILNYKIDTKSKKEIEFIKSWFSGSYKIEATAIGDKDYEFMGWSDIMLNPTVSTIDNPLEIFEYIGYRVIANFIPIINYGTTSTTSLTANADGWYEIRTKADLLFVANEIEKGGSPYAGYKYKIINNINYGGDYHKPIGSTTSGKEFTGVIDGNYKKIENAKFGIITGYSSYPYTYTGFLGYMGDGAVISNLTIDSSVVINTKAQRVGSIVGTAYGNITILNCVNEADISIEESGDVFAGGIAGQATGTVLNVYNTGNINVNSTGSDRLFIGGIVGSANDGTMSNVYNTGNINVNSTISSDINIGGIFAFNNSKMVLVNAYNTGDIYSSYSGTAIKPSLGGIIGYHNDSYTGITNVYSTGKVASQNGSTLTGGIVGEISQNAIDKVKNMYFVNASGLPTHGFGSSSTHKDSVDRTVADAGVSGTASWSAVLSAFSSSDWKADPLGRPVINGLGEGK